MKVYRVIMDRDGETTKENGKTSTAIIREELNYAANSIQEVWESIVWIRDDPERTLIGVFEVLPMITVIRPAPEGERE